MPTEQRDMELRCRILSQTGRLLNSLRLYEEAVPYLKETIELNRSLNDSINETYNLQLLGTVYLRAHDFEKAEDTFRAALKCSKYLDKSYQAKSLMYIAGVKYRIGQIDSAIIYIRNTPDLVKPIARNSALAYASDIYYAAGIFDSAYVYAHELINSKDKLNKATGYNVILSPGLQPFSPADTIYRYLNDYLRLLESYYNENENQLAVYQTSLHNYQIHDRERRKAEKENDVLRQWFFAVSFLILIMTIIILFLKNRSKNYKLKLHHALENIARLKHVLNDSTKENNDADKTEPKRNAKVTYNKVEETTEDLRKKLRKELLDLYNTNCKRIAFSTVILDSPTYMKLQSMISNGESIKENSELWAELEILVLKVSPNFITNLQLLVGGKLSSYDLHTSLLIKCGFQPTQMTILLNRAKGTIVSRRESLCFRVFEEKLGTKVIDGIIALL